MCDGSRRPSATARASEMIAKNCLSIAPARAKPRWPRTAASMSVASNSPQ